MQSSKEQQGEIRKPSQVINAKKYGEKKKKERKKEIGENNRMERLEISSRKLEIQREHFMQRWAQ